MLRQLVYRAEKDRNWTSSCSLDYEELDRILAQDISINLHFTSDRANGHKDVKDCMTDNPLHKDAPGI